MTSQLFDNPFNILYNYLADMDSIAEKLIELRLATRRACRKKDAQSKKSVLSLSDKTLFLLLKQPLPPDELMSALCIGSANLTHLTDGMIEEELIEKSRYGNDGRCVCYKITQKGTDRIRTALSDLDDNFKMIPRQCVRVLLCTRSLCSVSS